MDTQNRNTQDYPSRDKDPMQQLQVIRIPREFREKLQQARREREAANSDDTTEGLAPLVGLSVIAVLYLVGLLAAYTTGLGAAVLTSVTPAARSLITVLAVAGTAISVFWLAYAFARTYGQPENYRDYNA
jgi:hypothetical protein